jgi:ferritin
MLISKKMNAALNEQIGYEFQAMLQYVAIAAHFAGEGLSGLAAHFYKQAEEEKEHAMRFVKYVIDAGARVQVPDIPAPQSEFQTAQDAVALSLNHEKKVTDRINALVELAIKESDHITKSTLDWFVKEQLEEVSSMDNLLKVVQRAGENNLLFVEDHLARRKREAGKVELET